VTSLDRPVGEDGETAFGELMPSDRPSPDEEVEVARRAAVLRRAIRALPPREREVLVLRFGIDGGDPAPLREIGRRLGITQERVRQIESRALSRLAAEHEIAALGAAA
jgi:RNA polymerase primary sigma factor